MKIIILTIIMTLFSCAHPDPVALQNYLNYHQREQHHRDRMNLQMRAPMRPVVAPQAPAYTNPYNPMTQGSNPYFPMPGGY